MRWCCFLWLMWLMGCGSPPSEEQAAARRKPDTTVLLNQQPWPAHWATTRLEVRKRERRLLVYHHEKLVRNYKVALGRNPVGHKQFEGDCKTPEGHYTINWKNAHSAYYKNLGISYPNAADRARAKALGKPPGGDVKIHGLSKRWASMGKWQSNSDWTFGCIALSNPEMEELFMHTAVGTPIYIKP